MSGILDRIPDGWQLTRIEESNGRWWATVELTSAQLDQWYKTPVAERFTYEKMVSAYGSSPEIAIEMVRLAAMNTRKVGA